jgi:hypothetical protein
MEIVANGLGWLERNKKSPGFPFLLGIQGVAV